MASYFWPSSGSGGGGGVSSLNTLSGDLILAAGTGITITPSGGTTLTIASTSSGGTVTSVALTVPSWLQVAGSPITSSGTLAVTGVSQTANFFLASPNGSTGVLSPRAIVAADIPTLNQNTTGTAANITGTTNNTITTLSALSLPASQLTGTGNLTDAGTDGIVITSGTGAVIGSGTTIAQHVADATHNGYLLNTDWVSFNAKQASGNYLTALTGDITATGPGSVAATLATVNSNVGSFGSSTSIPSFTVNAKGLITAANGNVVIAPAGTLSGTTLNSTVVSSSLTSVGTITSGTWNGTTIAIANGGTGQTTANSALNALVPSQTGNAGKFLSTDGTNTSWGNPGSTQPITSKTTTYAITTSDFTILYSSSGGAYTTTLPTAVGIAGQSFQLIKTDANFNLVTIATTSAQTIGAQALSTVSLATQGESWTLKSDGSNWQIQEHYIPSYWVNSFSSSFTPSASFGTVTLQSIWTKRDGDTIRGRGYLKAGTTNTTNVATFGLPSGFVIDSSKYASSTSCQFVGPVYQVRTGTTTSNATPFLFFYDGSITNTLFISQASGLNVFSKQSVGALFNTSDGITFEFSFPVVGWNG